MENKRKKIIIVDDNASYLAIVRNLLKAFYDVYPAPTGKKLFMLMENFIPDIVLLDIDMPEMNGFEAISVMKENPRLKDIPVVFVTAKGDEESAVKGLDFGAVDYVTKPFYGPLLLRRISNLLLIEQLKRELQTSSAAIMELKAKQA
jgi:DNA-binding response OmpR family regulator